MRLKRLFLLREYQDTLQVSASSEARERRVSEGRVPEAQFKAQLRTGTESLPQEVRLPKPSPNLAYQIPCFPSPQVPTPYPHLAWPLYSQWTLLTPESQRDRGLLAAIATQPGSQAMSSCQLSVMVSGQGNFKSA